MAKRDNHKIIFEKALQLIHARACDGVSIDEILAALPVSRSSVERFFKLQVGWSARTELVRIRIEHAKTFLTSTDLPIKQIGQRIGYADVANFNRFFRNCVGVTPQNFRSGGTKYVIGNSPNAEIGLKNMNNAANGPKNVRLFL